MRNPKLISLLDKLDYVENYATGIERIIESYKPYKFKPEFDVSDNFFRVTLPNLNYLLGKKEIQNATNATNYATKNNKVSNVQNKILSHINNNNNITITELANAIDKDRSTILRNIKKLRELGLLDRDESKYSGAWIIIKK